MAVSSRNEGSNALDDDALANIWLSPPAPPAAAAAFAAARSPVLSSFRFLPRWVDENPLFSGYRL